MNRGTAARNECNTLTAGLMRAQALFMSDSIRDVRYGLRAMLRSPGFTIIALLTLMLGIGATTAIFSVVDAVLLRALPCRDPQRLVSVFEDAGEMGFPRNTPAPGNYADFKAQAQVFEEAAAEAYRQYNLTGTAGEPEKLNGAAVTQPVPGSGREASPGPGIPA